MKGLKVTQKKILDSTDSFFYDNGLVATVIKPNGTTLYLEVAGEVDINYKTSRYRNDQRFELIQNEKIDDKKLNRLTKSSKITWNMNNWFEVFIQKQGKEEVDSVLGDTASNYDDAMDLLRSYYDDEEF